VETSVRLRYEPNLIHRDNEVFLGGSYDTRHLTQSFITSNFYGTIQKVQFTLLIAT